MIKIRAMCGYKIKQLIYTIQSQVNPIMILFRCRSVWGDFDVGIFFIPVKLYRPLSGAGTTSPHGDAAPPWSGIGREASFDKKLNSGISTANKV